MILKNNSIKVSTHDLKTIISYKSGLAVSGRDDKIHIINSDESIKTLSPQISHVNSLIAVDNALIAGGQSGLIAIYDEHLQTPQLLAGHSGNVSSLCEKNGVLLSGSWDHTVRIWNYRSMSEVFKFDVLDCVWCVRFIYGIDNFLPLDFVVGTANGYISVYKNNIEWCKFKIHVSAVRSMEFSDGYLFSVGNDGKIMKCSIDGKLLNVHDLKDFMYSIYIDKVKGVVATGENGKVALLDSNLDVTWVGSIKAQSSWRGVIIDDNILVAGSDGVLYSLNEKETEVLDVTRKTDVSCSDVEKTGKKTKNVGLKDPNYKVVDGKVYFLENGEWNLIGDVVEEKKEYDHSFTVEVDNKNLTIEFNTNDNIFDVADKFLEQNNLSSSYKNDIVNFINQNFKPKASFYVYKNKNIDGIKNLLKDEFIIENLINPDINNNKEIAERLFVLLNMEDENFYVLDCYRIFHLEGFEFDFCFLQDYCVENKKSATVFLRLICNLMSNLPFAIEVLEAKIKRVIDMRLVDESTINNYRSNEELLNK